MNTKKIAFILLLSAVVLAVGGTFYYVELMREAQFRTAEVEFYDSSPLITPQPNLSSGSSSSTMKPRSGKTRNNHSSSQAYSVMPNSVMDDVLSSTRPSGIGGVIRSAKRKTDEDRVHTTNGGAPAVGLLFSQSSSTSGSSEPGAAHGITALSGTVQPPFAAPRSNGDGNVVLVDPGGDPTHRLPIGESTWLLALVSVVYGVLRLRRRG